MGLIRKEEHAVSDKFLHAVTYKVEAIVADAIEQAKACFPDDKNAHKILEGAHPTAVKKMLNRVLIALSKNN